LGRGYFVPYLVRRNCRTRSFAGENTPSHQKPPSL